MEEAAGRHNYKNSTWERRLVSEYTGLDFFQVGQLDYGLYLLWLRDAFIYSLNRTEEGREYLDNAWRMEQTEPDRPKLRKLTGKEAPARGN